MFIGTCATTSSGLANARTCIDLTLGVFTPSLLKTTLGIIYLDTSDICLSTSPIPLICLKADLNVEEFGSSNDSNTVE